jgi:hypothetical protein
MVDVTPAMELMTVVSPRGAPSLAEAARHFGVQAEDMDASFGVVPVDPERGLYAVRVRASKLPAQQSGAAKDFQGPWSDPAIAPFGPVQDGKNQKKDE